MRRHHVGALAALATAAAFAACTLNPQPLPPGDRSDFSGASEDASANSDGSGFGAVPQAPGSQDAATATAPADAADAGEAGDGGIDDGGDAGDADGG